MKYLKVALPLLILAMVVACARPPQAEIDAARAAVAAAAKNADISTYAADTLKTARDKLAQMESELAARHYDKVKSLAADARAAAEAAVSDAARNKQKAQSDASALIDALKQALPDARKKLAAARRVRGIRLDFASLAKELSDEQSSLAEAASDLANGLYASALQKATALQSRLSAAQNAISDAIQAAGRSKK